MTKAKLTDDLIQEIRTAESPPQPDTPTDGEPVGWEAQLCEAFRAQDDQTVDRIKADRDLLNEQIELLIVVESEEARLRAIVRDNASAGENVEQLRRHLEAVNQIRLTDVESATQVADQRAELATKLRRAETAEHALSTAWSQIAELHTFAPGLFAADDPIEQPVNLRIEPGCPCIDALSEKCREMNLSGLPDCWKDFRRPQAILPRKRFRLTAGGAPR